MKKTILNVKLCGTDEFVCLLNGNALEVMAANLSALQSTIESFKESEAKRGEQFLEMLLEDIEELFQTNGIRLDKKKGKRAKEND